MSRCKACNKVMSAYEIGYDEEYGEHEALCNQCHKVIIECERDDMLNIYEDDDDTIKEVVSVHTEMRGAFDESS